MRIKSITIRGFRGFCEERTIECDDRLTVIYAPNSYGKTSISEALEWLLYGVTSKVRGAESKDEYKGSYVNRHFRGPGNPLVKIRVANDDGSESEFRGEMLNGDTVKRFVDDEEVDEWPFLSGLDKLPEPFILQHALKDLLLATPDQRFMGFARMLGLEALDLIQKDVQAFCTKPQVHIPPHVQRVLGQADALVSRVSKHNPLLPIGRALSKGRAGLGTAHAHVLTECKRRVPGGTSDQAILPHLLGIREEAVGRVFKGNITLSAYSVQDEQSNGSDEQFFLGFLDDSFIQAYLSLAALRTANELLERAKFFNLGMQWWLKKLEQCPFCGQQVDREVADHIGREHDALTKNAAKHERLTAQREQVNRTLLDLRERLKGYHRRHLDRVSSLLSTDLESLKSVLGNKHEAHYHAVERAIADLSTAKEGLLAAAPPLKEALEATLASVTDSTESAAVAKSLGESIIHYLGQARALDKTVALFVQPTADAARVLKLELDTIAGTEEVSVLIDLLQDWHIIKAKFEVESVLEGLKEFRKTVDQYVGTKVLEAISSRLTSEVTKWYDLIKTEGDPDIHFDGFDLDRTVKGDLKARRVQVRAKSYGLDLVSAVSSLSESKLNALGLCMSIAANLRSPTPFEFLVVDDPIQSLDAEHETQFIGIVRKLVEEEGRQVILLSHNQSWLRSLRQGCRTVNGWYYEIKGYTVAGPVIEVVPWTTIQHRLQEIAAILEDPSASTIRLQQAEEEIRILVGEVTADLYLRVKGVYKSPHNLNSVKVRKMLVECSVPQGLVDRIEQTFITTDNAHHAPADYVAVKQRIRKYRSWVQELITYRA